MNNNKKIQLFLNILPKGKKLTIFIILLSAILIYFKRKFISKFIPKFIKDKFTNKSNSSPNNTPTPLPPSISPSSSSSSSPSSSSPSSSHRNSNSIFNNLLNSNNEYDDDNNDYDSKNKKKLIPKKISLNQLKKRRVCLSTIGTIFKKNVYYEHITDRRVSQFKFIESERDTLLKLAKESELFLITQIEDDQEEQQILDLLKSYGIIDSGLNINKCLFCSTSQGKGHISRHLEVYLHIEGSDIDVLTMLKPYVKNLVFIGNENKTTTTTTTTTTASSSNGSTSTGLSLAVSPNKNREEGIFSTSISLHDYFNN